MRVAGAAAPDALRLDPGGDKNVPTTGAVIVRNPNGVAVTTTASETGTP